jgi:hypothetical protein
MAMGGQSFIAEADTALDALLLLHPDKISAKSIFTLEHDGKTSSLSRRVAWTRYTLNSKAVAFHLAKNLSALLK